LYAALGYGWGDTLLALVAIVLGCPSQVSSSLFLLFDGADRRVKQTLLVLEVWQTFEDEK
jgi:hypothetical protein